MSNPNCSIFMLFILLGIMTSSCDDEYSDAMDFLHDNQNGHYTEQGTAVEAFLAKVYAADSTLDAPQLKAFWDEVATVDKPNMISDKDVITSKMLRHNTEMALETWRNSPWKEDVTFEMFCKYILPYRCMKEIVKDGWRDTLYNEYHHLIAGETDVKRAFEIIHDTIQRGFKQTSINIPYTLSVIDLNKIRHGSCEQRSVYEAGVMRALGIPAAVDGVSEWANYSISGHSWVALITKDGTYTVARGDSMARKNNPIDSSIFDLKKKLEEEHPFADIPNFKKTCAKIVRHSFEHNACDYADNQTSPSVRNKFANPFLRDVTNEYGRCENVIIETTDSIGYLCVFATGGDWNIPVAYARNNNGKMTFRNIRDSVAYIYGVYRNGSFVAKGNPFILCGKEKIYLNADTLHTQSMTLMRKYPLIAHFINYWMRTRGALFEASNDSSMIYATNTDRRLKHGVLLDSITRTPTYRTTIPIKDNKRYRYIHYTQPMGTKHTVSEIVFIHNDMVIKGTTTTYLVNDDKNCLDSNDYSYSEFRRHGSLLVDFGYPVIIDKIVYVLQNDDNYVVPGNEYELLYYDNGWHTLGCVRSKGYELTYKNAPSNAMYLLRNKTKGKEERIFTYENSKQVWW